MEKNESLNSGIKSSAYLHFRQHIFENSSQISIVPHSILM